MEKRHIRRPLRRDVGPVPVRPALLPQKWATGQPTQKLEGGCEPASRDVAEVASWRVGCQRLVQNFRCAVLRKLLMPSCITIPVISPAVGKGLCRAIAQARWLCAELREVLPDGRIFFDDENIGFVFCTRIHHQPADNVQDMRILHAVKVSLFFKRQRTDCVIKSALTDNRSVTLWDLPPERLRSALRFDKLRGRRLCHLFLFMEQGERQNDPVDVAFRGFQRILDGHLRYGIIAASCMPSI